MTLIMDKVDVTPDKLWVYNQTQQVYRFVDTAYDGCTMQHLCVYYGVGGEDDGRMFVCSLADFHLRFTSKDEMDARAAVGGESILPITAKEVDDGKDPPEKSVNHYEKPDYGTICE